MENLQDEFNKLLGKKYLFHIHTNYTDGKNSVEEYCFWASENSFECIVFIEHVRKNLAYNFCDFLADIKKAKQRFNQLDIWCGVESKILPNGQLDLPEEILPEIQIICFALHGFPENVRLYEQSCKSVFLNPKWKQYIRVWVHPGYFGKYTDTVNTQLVLLENLLSFAIREGIVIENNLRYKLLPSMILERIPNTNLVTGLDAHSIESVINLLSPKKYDQA